LGDALAMDTFAFCDTPNGKRAVNRVPSSSLDVTEMLPL
jgi:hypothetical protein